MLQVNKTDDINQKQNLVSDNCLILQGEKEKETGFAHKNMMEFVNGNINQNSRKLYSTWSVFLTEFFAILFISLYRWIHIHFLKKTTCYFSFVWLENAVIVIFLHFYMQRYSVIHTCSISGMVRHLKSLRSLLLLNVCQTVVLGYDFCTFTRKAGGTEFYQFSIALSVPIMLSLVCKFNICISNHTYISMILLSGWKIMILLQDSEFQMSFLWSTWCLLFSGAFCFYIILLKAHQENKVVELCYYLSLSLTIVLPIFILSNDNIDLSQLDVYVVFKIIAIANLLAFLKLGSCISILLVLQKRNSLVCLSLLNLSLFPDFLNQSLVYKLDCTLSGMKVCILYVMEFVIVHFKIDSKLRTSTIYTEDRKFSLMT